MKVILVTGGAGFMGSNFIRYFLRRNKSFIIVNIDKLTYAGNLDNLKEVEQSPRYHFIKGDLCNRELIDYVLKKYRPDYIINFASESNPERSIEHPFIFAQSNILGTLTLMDSARYLWNKNNYSGNLFIQVSGDDVYGNTSNVDEFFLEESSLLPNNPYSASKASADLLLRSFTKTYGFPAVITRGCSTYGPYQHMENFIPSCIINTLSDNPILIYGDGSASREWMNVTDHNIGIIRAMFYGKPGEIYNIGSGEEYSYMDIASKILKLLNKPEDSYKIAGDRQSQDKRYALNSYKIRNNLNWTSKYSIDEGLKETIQWYRANRDWWEI